MTHYTCDRCGAAIEHLSFHKDRVDIKSRPYGFRLWLPRSRGFQDHSYEGTWRQLLQADLCLECCSELEQWAKKQG